MRHDDRIQAFVKTIWSWYAEHKRTLPWRDLPDSDPAMRAYKILVSEVMLQQTQVSRVKIVFKSFLERFPTIQDLALATNREVLLAWRGMGYNSRAIRLRDAARVIETSFLRFFVSSNASSTNKRKNEQTIVFPSSMEELLQIPGIGSYTAAAIRNFAFHIPTPCIDTNIRRILHRTFVGPENPDGTWKKDDRCLLRIAEKLLLEAETQYVSPFLRFFEPANKQVNEQTNTRIHSLVHQHQFAPDWLGALMDFGSLIQTKRNPRWDLCPLTAKGIMKTTPTIWNAIEAKSQKPKANSSPKEPGRMVGSRFVPNRIFRGKIVEELRDAPEGLALDTIGARVCLDWSPQAHRRWLRNIVDKLIADRHLERHGTKFTLAQ